MAADSDNGSTTGVRINDSTNRKTCHQCRQRTRGLMATCKGVRRNKPCPLYYCYRCLLNRYGEKMEELGSSNEWKCPKCRGICNCSVCMQAKGYKPTGMLGRLVKANGYSSASHLLEVKGPENFDGSRKKVPMVNLVKNQGIESYIDEMSDFEIQFVNSLLVSDEQEASECKRKEFNGVGSGILDEDNINSLESNLKNPRFAGEGFENSLTSKEKEYQGNVGEQISKLGLVEGNARILESNIEMGVSLNGVDGCTVLREKKKIEMPPGAPLTTVADIELPAEDVGQALQFFEFSVSFAEVLDLKKGQAEAVIKDIINWQKDCGSKYSLIAQFHIQLLQLIQEDMEEESPTLSSSDVDFPWLQALGKCVAKYQFIAKEFPSNCFNRGNEGYDELTASQKFKLLNFLCDEVLNTEKMRSWIEGQKLKSREIAQEAKGKLNSAKEKEKDLKKKLQLATVKGLIPEAGDSLSVSEHAAIVLEIQNQAAQAHQEFLDAKNVLPKKTKRSDAFRTDPLLLDADGHVFWRLNSYSEEPHVLRQDVGAYGPEATTENWFVYEGDKTKEIQNYISSLSKRSRKSRKMMEATMSMETADTSSTSDTSYFLMENTETNS